jgi:hypothetical protein
VLEVVEAERSPKGTRSSAVSRAADSDGTPHAVANVAVSKMTSMANLRLTR